MYAGHKSDEGSIQPLYEHLTGVAELSAKFADSFGAGGLAYLIGLCHDIGKYSKGAQNRILNNGPKVDHSTAGGQEIFKLCGPIAAYCVFGHHGGLPNGGSEADCGSEASFYGRLKKKNIEPYSAFMSEVSLKTPSEPAFSPLGAYGFSLSLLIRMLFSCLVDADFLDTEKFMSNDAIQREGYDSIPVLYYKINECIKPFFNPTSELNRKRSEILKNCLNKAENDKGLFSLTVPTGGGKTISSLAFALAHAKRNNMDRVIYVIPYTSIIEQNAAVFANVLGDENVLEHHSSVDYSNEEPNEPDALWRRKYLSTENWNAPVVVTTNVQFFESLFAAKTSKCRKLHNIANSVIIFDEAQMLPIPFLLPCVRTIAELIHNFGCTAVLCSATQPALDGFLPKEIERTEICDDPGELYISFRRTRIELIGKLADTELAERLNASKQALCIVNTRKQAQNVYNMLDEKGSFHLSTLMYPEHRKTVLKEIRSRLADGLTCRVVATSLIEAGVDVDFPVVYRAAAGLDSLIQAAGRCNREGKRPALESIVYAFEPEDTYSTPNSQLQALAAFNIVARKHEKDLASLEAIHDYFEALYGIKGDALDVKRILPQLEDCWKNGSFPFRAIAQDFKLIETPTRTVLITNKPEGISLAKRLRNGERSRNLLRNVGRYSVNIYERHFSELMSMGIVECVDDEISILAEIDSYSEDMGLTLTPEGGKAVFI